MLPGSTRSLRHLDTESSEEADGMQWSRKTAKEDYLLLVLLFPFCIACSFRRSVSGFQVYFLCRLDGVCLRLVGMRASTGSAQ